MTSSDYREMLREWSVDMRRGVDYLRTRPDIDAKHIAYWVTSTTEAGVVFAAVDGRYAAIILNGADVYPSVLGLHPDINPLHFAPHIRGPKLLLTGRYDELTGSRVTSIDPIYRLLPEPKKNVTYIGGHVPPNEIAVPLVNNFLNNVMGKVARHQP